VDPYVLRQRGMTAWHELDELIHHRPGDALRVFERIAQKHLISWTFEGLRGAAPNFPSASRQPLRR
jgi:hypothetical protein